MCICNKKILAIGPIWDKIKSLGSKLKLEWLKWHKDQSIETNSVIYPIINDRESLANNQHYVQSKQSLWIFVSKFS